jgi:chemotaxis protein MotA
MYGAMLANMVATPIANKLALRKGQEKLNRRLIMDGLLAIQDGQNPRVIDGFLKNYLNESKREVDVDN